MTTPSRASVCGLVLVVAAWASAQASDAAKEVQSQSEGMAKQFDAGNAEGLAGLFLPDGEMISEDGTVFRGRDELTALFKDFFQRFPGAKLTLQTESVRTVGPSLAIEDGSRSIMTKEGESRADLRFSAVWSKTEQGWRIASIRDVAADAPITSHSVLTSLSWMIGEWVNEGDDAAVKISYRWSEDGNYILGEFDVISSGRRTGKSTQRIAWDPAGQRIRSWFFEEDGGFSEGTWTPTADGWRIHSLATLPDGVSASAMLSVLPQGSDRFVIKGTDRLIGGVLDNDFEMIVTKRPSPASAGATRKEAGNENK